MNQVQNGGVSNPGQEYIKNEEVRNRPISDRVFETYPYDFGDEDTFRDLMRPGSFHYMASNPGTGKTHLLVNIMYLLLQGYNGCGEWEIVTNIFMYNRKGGETEVGTPDRVHHIDSLEELFGTVAEISDRGRYPALLLDDYNRYFNEEGTDILSKNLRRLIVNRKKLKLLLFLSGTEQIGIFGNDWPSHPYACDCSWYKTGTEREWEQAKSDFELDVDWKLIEETSLTKPNILMAFARTTVTEWTNPEVTEGWTYDRFGDASVLRCGEGFDFDSFWKGLENVSALSAPTYIRRYMAEDREKRPTEIPQTQTSENVVEIAVKLKSMGLTDEAIECAVGVPKTTLRRRAEKAGFGWKNGAVNVPFRFKSIRASTQDCEDGN